MDLAGGRGDGGNRVWLAVFICWLPLYVVSVLVLDHETRDWSGWRRTVVNIIRTPLEPLRKPFRRTATRPNPLFIPKKCEVCGEVDIFRFWERVPGNPPAMRLRRFCSQHHREYLDSPADALKPDIAW